MLSFYDFKNLDRKNFPGSLHLRLELSAKTGKLIQANVLHREWKMMEFNVTRWRTQMKNHRRTFVPPNSYAQMMERTSDLWFHSFSAARHGERLLLFISLMVNRRHKNTSNF